MIHLTGEKLAIALQRTVKPFELRDINGQRIQTFQPGADITPYLTAGYSFFGTKHRVRYVSPAPPIVHRRPDLPWLPCWRTEYAAVIAWHGVQFTPGIRIGA